MNLVPSPPNDESRELFRLLADKQWHPYQQVKTRIAEKVSPGRAYRKYQEEIEARRRMLNDSSYDTQHDDTMRIQLGARRCAQSAISSWNNKGVVIEGKGEQKRIKAKPGFTSPWFPGFEPDLQNPALETQGGTEGPPGDSEPSEDEQDPAEPALPDQQDLIEVIVADSSDGAEAVEEPVEEPEPEPEPEQPAEPSPEAPLAAPEGDYAGSDSLPLALGPACPDCGLAVCNWALHESWHQGFVKRSEQPEMALLNESQLAELLRDVIGMHLDGFQVGMQAYLDTQFAQVQGALLHLATTLKADRNRSSWRAQ